MKALLTINQLLSLCYAQLNVAAAKKAFDNAGQWPYVSFIKQEVSMAAIIGSIGFCLTNAERRISDAAYGFQRVMEGKDRSDARKAAARADMLADETEARKLYAMAAEQGWDGDVDAMISLHWATYLPTVSAELIGKLREKALAEAAVVAH